MSEDRTVIRERHGLQNARRVRPVELGQDWPQAVTVFEGKDDEVILNVSSDDPTVLTPEQADLLAKQLTESAVRVRTNKLRNKEN